MIAPDNLERYTNGLDTYLPGYDSIGDMFQTTRNLRSYYDDTQVISGADITTGVQETVRKVSVAAGSSLIAQ